MEREERKWGGKHSYITQQYIPWVTCEKMKGGKGSSVRKTSKRKGLGSKTGDDLATGLSKTTGKIRV